MELDQILFQKLARWYKARKGLQIGGQNPAGVDLEPLKSRLSLLGAALAETKIEVHTARREGGIQGHRFFFPARCELFGSTEQNLSFYLFRTCYMAFEYLLRDAEQASDSESVLAYMQINLPKAVELYQSLREALALVALSDNDTNEVAWLTGRVLSGGVEGNVDLLVANKQQGVHGEEAEPEAITTEIEAKAADEVTVIEVNKKAQEEYMLTHNFEKVETAEEFDGLWRNFDGADELADQQDALEELDLKFTVRTDDPVHSVYRAEYAGQVTAKESSASESEGRCIAYDEWDFAKNRYIREYCKVFERAQIREEPDTVKGLLQEFASVKRQVQKEFQGFNNRMVQKRFLSDGDDLDLDHVLHALINIKTGHSPDDNIYTGKRKQDKDLAILFLLDISLSSDAYASGNRVLDIEKLITLILGDVLWENDIDFEVAAYNSRTRNQCNYIVCKGFDEKWPKAKYRVTGLEAEGYTRIGPALRHAGARMKGLDAQQKWVVLLSDGKPSDYDKYEGNYGLKDVRQALRELARENVHAYAFAVESNALYNLPIMFGHNNYRSVSGPGEILQGFSALYSKIKCV